MGAGKMTKTLRDWGDGPRAELGVRLRILKMMQNWSGLMKHSPMQNLSNFSVTWIWTVTLNQRRAVRCRRLLRDRANPRRHAWTGETVLHAQRHALPTNVHGVGNSFWCASGGQTANCAAFTSQPGRKNRRGRTPGQPHPITSSLLSALSAWRTSR
jgi:hypothetical protein